MTNKPTFVFVPGAGHTAETWDKVSSLLNKQGYGSINITLPSTLGDPNATYLDDIQTVRTAIISATSQGQDVIVVAHSYGGYVGASAFKDVPTVKNPPSPQSTSGKVIGHILVASGFNVPNMTLMDAMGGKPPPSWTPDFESGFGLFTNNPPPKELFYHDLPDAEADVWTSKLTKQSMKALYEGAEHVYDGWRDVPNWYLVTANDRALPAEAQWKAVEMGREAGASVEAREIAAGHSPMLAKPEETVEFFVDAATAFTK